MDQLCEPPPDLQGEDGWHWVQMEREIVPMRWLPQGTWDWDGDTYPPGGQGWRYIAPAVPPDMMALVLTALDAAVRERGPTDPRWEPIRAALARYTSPNPPRLPPR